MFSAHIKKKMAFNMFSEQTRKKIALIMRSEQTKKRMALIMSGSYLMVGLNIGRHAHLYLLAWVLLACHLLYDTSKVLQKIPHQHWAVGEYTTALAMFMGVLAMKALCIVAVVCVSLVISSECTSAFLNIRSPLQQASDLHLQATDATTPTPGELPAPEQQIDSAQESSVSNSKASPTQCGDATTPGDLVAPEQQIDSAQEPSISDSKTPLTQCGDSVEKEITVADPQDCLEIIRAKGLKCKGLRNVLTTDESRARPNRRLVVGFGIENCFTTSEPKVCNAFRNQVNPLLQVDRDRWAVTAASVKQVIRDELVTTDDTLNLAALAKMVSLKSVLSPLFNYDVSDHGVDESIRQLADEINKQWILTKDYDGATSAHPEWAFENQTELRQALQDVFPNWDSTESENNPLNLILPGYETLWRVVLRCFIELTARSHDNAETWCQSIQAFVQDPTRDQLESEQAGSPGISAANVARETLRLYPPTRRIYREYETTDGKTRKVAADIEQMQRDRVVWGKDALVFRPERWQGISHVQGEAKNFLPFGETPFACPARRRWPTGELPFGLSMIALMVGVLTAEIVGKWELVGDLPDSGEPLETSRHAYGDLLLKRVPVLDGT